MKDAELLFNYHDAIIATAKQKVARNLTPAEMQGIRNIYSFLMLEALEMTLIHKSVEQVEKALEHIAKQTTIFKL